MKNTKKTAPKSPVTDMVIAPSPDGHPRIEHAGAPGFAVPSAGTATATRGEAGKGNRRIHRHADQGTDSANIEAATEKLLAAHLQLRQHQTALLEALRTAVLQFEAAVGTTRDELSGFVREPVAAGVTIANVPPNQPNPSVCHLLPLASSPSHALLTSTAVMALLGYRDRGAFWAMVHAEGIPFVRINLRTIKFPSAALDEWLRNRRSDAA